MSVRLATEIVQVGRIYLGRMEEPNGSNDAPWMYPFLSDVGHRKGDKWCLQFAMGCWYHAAKLAGLGVDFVDESGNCQEFLSVQRQLNHVYSSATRGSIYILFDSSGHAYHAGICENSEVRPGFFRGIEGNTSSDKSPNGNAVWLHTRPLQSARFVVPDLVGPGGVKVSGAYMGSMDGK